MKQEDIDFIETELLDKASWLFYGDLDEHFDDFLKKIFSHELTHFGFDKAKMTPDFSVAYWLFISELISLDFAEYGTSPRGAWLTEKGKRLKKIVLENENAINEVNEYIYKKYNC